MDCSVTPKITIEMNSSCSMMDPIVLMLDHMQSDYTIISGGDDQGPWPVVIIKDKIYNNYPEAF